VNGGRFLPSLHLLSGSEYLSFITVWSLFSCCGLSRPRHNALTTTVGGLVEAVREICVPRRGVLGQWAVVSYMYCVGIGSVESVKQRGRQLIRVCVNESVCVVYYLCASFIVCVRASINICASLGVRASRCASRCVVCTTLQYCGSRSSPDAGGNCRSTELSKCRTMVGGCLSLGAILRLSDHWRLLTGAVQNGVQKVTGSFILVTNLRGVLQRLLRPGEDVAWGDVYYDSCVYRVGCASCIYELCVTSSRKRHNTSLRRYVSVHCVAELGVAVSRRRGTAHPTSQRHYITPSLRRRATPPTSQ